MKFMFLIIRAFVKCHYFLFGRSSPHPPVFSKGSRVLLSISGGIGDAVMALPMVRALHSYNPQLKIDVMVSPATRAIIEHEPHVDRIWLVNPKIRFWFPLVRSLRRERYDVYIGKIPSNTIRKVLLPYFAGIRYRIKHRTREDLYENYDFLFHHIESIPDGRHRVLCNLDLLTHLGVPNVERFTVPVLHPVVEAESSAKVLLSKWNFDEQRISVGFHPGCNPAAAHKRWSPDHYARLGDYLQIDWNLQVIIVGGPDEEADVRKIVDRMKVKPINGAGQCGLLETAAIIRHCRFFVSNDSGIMHLATSVGVPTFAIFGPTNEKHIGPVGPQHTVIRNGTDVNSVTVEQVIRVLTESPVGLKSIEKSGSVPTQ